ncbi:MAG: NAD+ synthase [Candidatus Omnitrophota bacterium]
MMDLSAKIADWIKKQVRDAGKKGIIVGLSGGIDSSVVAALSKRAVGDNVRGLILPCKSNSEDVELAYKVSKRFNIKTEEVVLDKLFDQMVNVYPAARDLAKSNLKPRLRMTTLYYFANALDYLVAGTGNRTELVIGYFTKYGDGGVDILPIGGLLKSGVRKLAKKLDVPGEIIARPPSAGLWHGQTDEGEIGITYDELDRTINAINNGKTSDIDKEILAKVNGMIKNSEHKRCAVPIFEE